MCVCVCKGGGVISSGRVIHFSYIHVHVCAGWGCISSGRDLVWADSKKYLVKTNFGRKWEVGWDESLGPKRS